jgi:hypothetical protein
LARWDEILEEYLASRNSHAPSQETNKDASGHVSYVTYIG